MDLPAWAATPGGVRDQARRGLFNGNTSGMAPGFGQGNLAILPKSWAEDFYRFCQANPTPCPLIGMTQPGDPAVPMLGEDIDLRTDLPRYRVWRDGVLVEELDDISALWQDEFVGFVLGCSLSFEYALERAGLRVRHVDEGKIVPMYHTSIQTTPVGPFQGPMVVSMRPYTPEEAKIAYQVCERLPGAHGAPVHIGDPAAIGIRDIDNPEEGEPTEIKPGEVPVFWACGVTPQAAALHAKPPILITHSPGHMLVSDIPVEQLRLM
ncbi:putative hydro-lyase [Bordetella sp. 15P40C-2]|uniref:putative hydro-lyase n=1 Tax=Bordetella sp. 15P40C-2 TaxID=2572246 RepID=UPI001365EC56